MVGTHSLRTLQEMKLQLLDLQRKVDMLIWSEKGKYGLDMGLGFYLGPSGLVSSQEEMDSH